MFTLSFRPFLLHWNLPFKAPILWSSCPRRLTLFASRITSVNLVLLTQCSLSKFTRRFKSWALLTSSQILFEPRYISSSPSVLQRKKIIPAHKRKIPLFPEVRILSHNHLTIPYTYIRYKIRGVRNLIFYGLPDHPQFYTEFLSFPFLDDGVDASDVTCKALYCKYDWMKLERIAGTERALELLKSASWVFILLYSFIFIWYPACY